MWLKNRVPKPAAAGPRELAAAILHGLAIEATVLLRPAFGRHFVKCMKKLLIFAVIAASGGRCWATGEAVNRPQPARLAATT